MLTCHIDKYWHLDPVVNDLGALDWDKAGEVGVIEVLDRHRVTMAQFRELDEHPGHWAYKDAEGREWHWKLRRTRNNPNNNLFEKVRP